MTTIIKGCSREKTKGIRALDRFRNKLMIPQFLRKLLISC